MPLAPPRTYRPESPEHVPLESSIEPFPAWTLPTPPRSESGVPKLLVDDNNCALSYQSAPLSPGDMSSMSYLLPSTSSYDPSHYDEFPMDGYSHNRTLQPTVAADLSPYSITTSPTHYQSKQIPARRHSDLPPEGYVPAYRRVEHPYDQQQQQAAYTMVPGRGVSVNELGSAPSAHAGFRSAAATTYQYPYSTTASASRTPSAANSAHSSAYAHAAPQHSFSYPPPYHPNAAGATETVASAQQSSSMRAVNERPKPQCWEHGCNGRQFSTFSNLLRHQREKAGTAAKSKCPKCGAEFTRTTARNGHVAHDKCQDRRK
ncbi:hypothetical protein K470DRAFT_262439 [Piedraia hortae CBS 480.64]|uniref:C2H2-type domain-containing protein n=1 Tax=Piedraia hortae CBS 480.64 TaxID=1314780 RepID=A0A6A7C7A8_9PEZI|nr:hypothetical protein K470DRAFT_262439 [Piedraia hortae CBS 480.64]